MHSYPLQIFLECGILAFIAFIGGAVYTIILMIKAIKNKKNIYSLSILISVIIMLLHSMIDFDLSFLYNLMILFVGIGILAINDSKKGKNSKGILAIILICICAISLIFNVSDFVLEKTNKLSKINMYNKTAKEQYIRSIKKENIDVLYNLAETEKGEKLDYINKIAELLIKYENNDINSIMQKLYDNIGENNYSVSVINSMDRNEQLIEIAEILLKSNNINVKKYAGEFANIAINEYNKNIELLEQKEKNRLDKENINKYKEQLDRNMKKAEEIKEREYE